MDELIKIGNTNGIRTVNARELWEKLESKRQFANWIKDRLYGFIDGVDFTVNKFVNGKATQKASINITSYKMIVKVYHAATR